MKRIYSFGLLALISLLSALVFAACGEATSTSTLAINSPSTTAAAITAPATTAAVTTAAATTAASTTKAATTVAATTAPTTTAPATTAPATTAVPTTAKATTAPATTAAATTAASAGNKVTVPTDGTFPGDLAVLQKVLNASNDFKSVKMVLTSSIAAGPSGTVIVVKPDNVSVDLTTSGQRQGVISLGKDVYISQDGKTWTKTDASGFNAVQLIASLNQGSLDQIKRLAGSTFTVKPDEKLDGKDVGVLELDTATSTGPDAAQLQGGKLIYKYSKQDFHLQQVLVKTSLVDLDTHYVDYDSPNNKVEAPKI